MKKEDYYKSYCLGCGLCHSCLGTNYSISEKGFKAPDSVDLSFAEKYCPVSVDNCNASCSSDNIWGDYVEVKRGYSKDSNLRKMASSGGLLSEIASYLLEKKLVDGVIHVGVGESPMSTKVYVSKSREEVISHCGSRYIQSSPLESIVEILEQEGTFAFIGKPCDVMILKNYLKSNPELEKKVYCMLSFFCAGMPSLKANDELVKKMGCDEQIKSIMYRGNGWPGFATVEGLSGKKYTMPYSESWGHVLGRDKHKFCRLCMDGIGLFADIVCADAWYIKNNKPDFSENEGRNLVIVRSDKGKNIIEGMEKEELVVLDGYDEFEKEMPVIQKYQYERRSTMKTQVFALKLLGIKLPKYKLSLLKKYGKFTDFKAKKNIFIGTLKRALKGRYR